MFTVLFRSEVKLRGAVVGILIRLLRLGWSVSLNTSTLIWLAHSNITPQEAHFSHPLDSTTLSAGTSILVSWFRTVIPTAAPSYNASGPKQVEHIAI